MMYREALSLEVVPGTPGEVRVRVTGDLDSATSEDLRVALAEQQANAAHVVLDLSRLRFVDSTGLRVLVDAARSSGNGWTVELIDDLPAHLRRLMGITGTLAMFRLVRR
jgi:anti-anti-sigma factor